MTYPEFIDAALPTLAVVNFLIVLTPEPTSGAWRIAGGFGGSLAMFVWLLP